MQTKKSTQLILSALGDITELIKNAQLQNNIEEIRKQILTVRLDLLMMLLILIKQ